MGEWVFIHSSGCLQRVFRNKYFSFIFALFVMIPTSSSQEFRPFPGAEASGRFVYQCLLGSYGAEQAANDAGVVLAINDDESERSISILLDIDDRVRDLEMIGVQSPSSLGYRNAVVIYIRFFTNRDAYIFEIKSIMGSDSKWVIRSVNFIDPWDDISEDRAYNLINTPFPIGE